MTGATREEGRLLSSIVAGLLLVGYNYFGAYQQGILFVVLLMNIINHHIDTVTEKRMQKERLRYGGNWNLLAAKVLLSVGML